MTSLTSSRALAPVLALGVAVGSVIVGLPDTADARVRVRARGRAYASTTVVAAPLSGWYLGLGLAGTNIVNQAGGSEQLRSGVGYSLYGGLHVNELLSLELGLLESFHNPVDVSTWYGNDVDFLVLDGFTFDARVHLGQPSQRFDPYLQGGLGLYTLASQFFGLDSVGTGFQLGGGVDMWLSQVVTLGGRVRYHGIAMGPPDSAEDDLFISALTIEGSLSFQF